MKDSQRLKYKKWTKDDIDAMVKGLNNPKMARFLGTAYPFTEKDAENYINSRHIDPKRLKQLVLERYAICLKETDEIIGGVCMGFEKLSKKIVYGKIWINEEHQDKGYGAEAFDARNAYYFNELGFLAVRAAFDHGNVDSQKMQERVGFRAIETKEDKGKTFTLMGITKEDWLKQRQDSGSAIKGKG